MNQIFSKYTVTDISSLNDCTRGSTELFSRMVKLSGLIPQAREEVNEEEYFGELEKLLSDVENSKNKTPLLLKIRGNLLYSKGRCFDKGLGGQKIDYLKARGLFEKSIEDGNPQAI